MKLSISAVWDRTVEFLSDNVAAVAGIAALGLFLPFIAIQLLQPWAATAGGGTRIGLGLLAVALSVVTFLARLTLIALVLAPVAGPGAAWRTGLARAPAAVGISLLLFCAVMLAVLPISLLSLANGVDLAAVSNGDTASVGGGASGAIALYLLVAGPVLLWVATRLSPLWPVVVGERRGIGAVPRAFRLSRSAAARIFGALLLFVVVANVASLATKFVSGAIMLLLSEGRGALDAATIVPAVLTAAVAAAAWTVVAAFLAQLYVALRDRADPVPAAA